MDIWEWLFARVCISYDFIDRRCKKWKEVE